MSADQSYGVVPEGLPASYYRKRAAQWLNGAGEFRRFVVGLWGHPTGYATSLYIVRDRIAMARANRAAIAKAKPR